MKRLLVEVPATSANLGPGFDTVGVALNLVDRIEVELDPSSDDVMLSPEGLPQNLELDPEDNLLCRAYREWGRLSETTLPGAFFTLRSEIPIGRGLGSSAASIIGGLAAAAGSVKEKGVLDRIVQIGARLEGHPDNIAAAAMGGLTVAFVGEGGARALHVANHLSLGVALFIPTASLSTGLSRAALPQSVPLEDASFNLGRLAYLVTALMWGRWEEIGEAMQDRLHQPYRRALNPILDELIGAALEVGAFGASLSGSGPTIIALTSEKAAKEVATAFEQCAGKQGIEGRSLVTEVRHLGVTVRERKEGEAI